MTFTKSSPTDLPEAIEIESAGISWLQEASTRGGPKIVEIVEVKPGLLHLERISATTPDAEAAATFGAQLAALHSSLPEGSQFGELPPRHPEVGFTLFGPAAQPVKLKVGQSPSWGAFHASQRLQPILDQLLPQISENRAALYTSACERIASGYFDMGAEIPARLHGDLWSGNVLWQASDDGGSEVVLIDPAAHAGHPLDDLALLELFGLPYQNQIIAAYLEASHLEAADMQRIPVHQFFYLLAHELLFGSAYSASAKTCARSIMDL